MDCLQKFPLPAFWDNGFQRSSNGMIDTELVKRIFVFVIGCRITELLLFIFFHNMIGRVKKERIRNEKWLFRHVILL